MNLKLGKHGEFWSCSKYPECKGTKSSYSPRNYEERLSGRLVGMIIMAFVVLLGCMAVWILSNI